MGHILLLYVKNSLRKTCIMYRIVYTKLIIVYCLTVVQIGYTTYTWGMNMNTPSIGSISNTYIAKVGLHFHKE